MTNTGIGKGVAKFEILKEDSNVNANGKGGPGLALPFGKGKCVEKGPGKAKGDLGRAKVGPRSPRCAPREARIPAQRARRWSQKRS